jgi:hypothetical protein
VELASGVTMKYVDDSSSLLLVVASCSSIEIVAANCGVLGVVVASLFGRWLMVPIFIFNISSFRPLLYLYSCIIAYTTFGSTELVSVSQPWPSLILVHTEYKSKIGICLVKVTGSYNSQSYY